MKARSYTLILALALIPTLAPILIPALIRALILIPALVPTLPLFTEYNIANKIKSNLLETENGPYTGNAMAIIPKGAHSPDYEERNDRTDPLRSTTKALLIEIIIATLQIYGQDFTDEEKMGWAIMILGRTTEAFVDEEWITILEIIEVSSMRAVKVILESMTGLSPKRVINRV